MSYRGCKGINSNLYHGKHKNSYFRLMNILPCGATVDVYVNGKLIAQDLSHNKTSLYWSVMPGKYNVKVYPRGQTVDPILDTIIYIQQGYVLNLVIIGSSTKARLYQAEEGVKRLNDGKAYIRFINLSPNPQEIDIVIPDITQLFRDIRNEEATNYVRIPLGTYIFNACESGINHLLASIRNIQLDPNKYYTGYIIEALRNPKKLEVLMVNEQR